MSSTCISSSSFPTSSFHCNNTASASTLTSTASVQSCPSLYKIWHYRLGHPHYEVLKSVMKLCNQNLRNKMLSDFCSACCSGKVHRLPSFTSTATYNKPLELIFCDLWGPAPVESFEGYTYFLTCVDAYSRVTWIFPLKLRSHTLITFQNFKKMVELPH